MKFSIVTPSYNQAQFVRDTIESVSGQTHSDYEYIAVDGVSNDGTLEILKACRDRVDKIIIEHDDGQADAINKGFSHATGEIYAYLNSDDYYFKNTLNIVNEYFENNPDVDVVYGDCVFTDKVGQFVRYFSEIDDFNSDRLLNFSDIIMQPATFWRREVFEKYGPFDKDMHFGFDWAFWCELASRGCRFQRIPFTLAANRVYPQTKTSSGSVNRLKEIRIINNKYRTRWLLHAYYRFYLAELIENRNWHLMDYLRFPFLVLLSYGNIMHHFAHYNSKIIHGFMPKSMLIQKHARICMPKLDYTTVLLELEAPERIDQSVTVYSGGMKLGDYHFETGCIKLEIPLTAPEQDVDVVLQFENEYPRYRHIVKRILMAYQPAMVAARITRLEMCQSKFE